MDWYDNDFGQNDEDILKYVSQFLPEGISQNINNNLSEWDVSYLSYNWNLNEFKN